MKKLLLITCLTFIASKMQAQEYVLGEVIKGGIVVFIAENGDSLLICGKNDAAQYVNWEDAKMRCESFFSIDGSTMVRGWRMPTVLEVKRMRADRENINNLISKTGGTPLDIDVGTYYWTSDEGENKDFAYLQGFGFDLDQLMSKESNSFHARAVQTVYLKKKTVEKPIELEQEVEEKPVQEVKVKKGKTKRK
jgi:hypothetical protein